MCTQVDNKNKIEKQPGLIVQLEIGLVLCMKRAVTVYKANATVHLF